MAANVGTSTTTRKLQGSDTSVYYALQANEGELNDPLVLTPLRRSEGSNKRTTAYSEGSEAPQSRQAIKQIAESIEATAEISTSVSKQSIANFIAALCGGDETVLTDTDTGYAATGTGFTGANDAFLGYAVGDYVFVEGFANATIDRIYLITAKADDETITTYPTPAATESAGASVTAQVNKSYSGDEPTLLIMQKRITDLSKTDDLDYQTDYDGYIGSFSLGIPETGALTSSMSIGFGSSVSGTDKVTGQSDSAIPADAALSSSKSAQNVEDFIINGVTAMCSVKSMEIEYGNNTETDAAAGCTTQYSLGTITCTAAIVVRAPISSPLVWRDYYIAGTDLSSVGVTLNHGGGDKTVLIMDNCKVTEHEQPDAGGTTANASVTCTAQVNDTLSSTFRIYRNWV
jgi:hypothetical protein